MNRETDRGPGGQRDRTAKYLTASFLDGCKINSGYEAMLMITLIQLYLGSML